MTDVPVNPIAVPAKKTRGYKLTTTLFFLLIAITVIVGFLLKAERISMTGAWGVIALGMLAFVAALGLDLQQNALGIFISERNLMSLARFQLACWTVLICSAFVAIGLARVFATAEDPLGIAIPSELWQILGISTASTVGASLVLKNKTTKEPANEEKVVQKVAAQTEETPEAVQSNRQGVAYANPSPKDARITDMFEGDELANTAHIDVSKVQMFFFTLVAIIAYGVNIYQYMVDNTPETLNTFPALSSGLVAVLGISHAAYLGNKSITHTKTKDE